jgi:hypothetical protein
MAIKTFKKLKKSMAKPTKYPYPNIANFPGLPDLTRMDLNPVRPYIDAVRDWVGKAEDDYYWQQDKKFKRDLENCIISKGFSRKQAKIIALRSLDLGDCTTKYPDIIYYTKELMTFYKIMQKNS